MKKTLFTIILKWGFILGVVLSLLQFLRTFNNMEYFAIGPILDLMHFVAFVGILLLGMKEYRSEMPDNSIKFTKAFLSGVAMTVIAFVLMVVYLTIHYDYIDKEGIHKLNERNVIRYTERIETDTVTDEDITMYLNNVTECLQTTALNEQMQGYDSVIQQNLAILKKYYVLRMQNRTAADSNAYRVGNFDRYAQRLLLELTEQIVLQQEKDTSCNHIFIHIVQTTIQHLQKETLFHKRYQNNINQLPQYTNTLATALYFSIAILLYGLFFSIFVALYVYRKKTDENAEITEEENNNTIEVENDESFENEYNNDK